VALVRNAHVQEKRVNRRDYLLAWLNDAYAMENGLIPVLENHASDAKDFPMIQARDREHLEQTRRHAEMVKSCIERLGGNVNSIKSGLGKVTGTIQGMATAMAHDEVIKNCLSDFAAENFEVASYQALIAAAQDLGDQETAAVCRQILGEDADMANWIIQNLPMAVTQFLQRQEASGQAA
jgi:ferritin-like metal-binding protein YciE